MLNQSPREQLLGTGNVTNFQEWWKRLQHDFSNSNEDAINYVKDLKLTSSIFREGVWSSAFGLEQFFSLAVSALHENAECISSKCTEEEINSANLLICFLSYVFPLLHESQILSELLRNQPEDNHTFVQKAFEFVKLLIEVIVRSQRQTVIHKRLWTEHAEPVLSKPLSLIQSQLVLRNHVYRLLLIVMSEALYVPFEGYEKADLFWLNWLCYNTCDLTVEFFKGLTNEALVYSPWKGGLLTRNGGSLSQIHENFYSNCFHLWCILISHGWEKPRTMAHIQPLPSQSSEDLSPPCQRMTDNDNGENSIGEQNQFAQCINSIDDSAELEYLFNEVNRLLEVVVSYRLREKDSRVQCHEILSFIWGLRNSLSKSYQNGSVDLNRFFRSLLTCLPLYLKPVEKSFEQTDKTNHPEQTVIADSGISHIIGFILLDLSSRRNFYISLNKPVDKSRIMPGIPLDKVGCDRDLLIAVIHNIVCSPKSTELAILSDLFLTILANVSPFVKQLTEDSGRRMLSMLRRSIKLADKYGGPFIGHVYLLIEILNNMIQYQYEANVSLVYMLLREKSIIEELKILPQTDWAKNDYGENNSGITANDNSDNVDVVTQLADEDERSAEADLTQPPESWLSSQPKVEAPLQNSLSGEKNWRVGLPIGTITNLINHLEPIVLAYCREHEVFDAEPMIRLISESIVLDILPPPQKLFLRVFQHSIYTGIWLISYFWGLAFMSELMPLPTYNTDKILLLVFMNQ